MTEEHHTSGCIICGRELEYIKHPEKMNCAICGQEYEAQDRCMEGHFVCNDCHSTDAIEMVLSILSQTEETDAVKLATTLMHSSLFHMHGPEHHFLVPLVLITVYRNYTGEKEQKIKDLKLASFRAKSVPGGFCGSHGACGAALGTGIAVSVLLNCTPLKNEEWALSGSMTSQTQARIAEIGGPRCCKRTLFLSMETAIPFLNDLFNVQLQLSKVHCTWQKENKECIGTRCPFFSKKSS